MNSSIKNYESLCTGVIFLSMVAVGALASSFKVPPILPLVLPFFWPCMFLMGLVVAICWRLMRVTVMARRHVLRYGVLIILCAAELHFCVEYMLRGPGPLQLFLSDSPAEPLLLVVRLLLSLFSGVVQFGIAALGSGICVSALLAGHTFPRSLDASTD